LAVSLGDAADKVAAGLAAKMREVAATNDRVFAEAHPGNSRATIDAAALWSNAYGGGPPASQANVYLLRYRQVGCDAYRRVALRIADQYRSQEIHLARPVWPGTVGNVIQLMLEAHELTGDEQYLESAERFSAGALRLFLADACPLPRASHGHGHYEAVTNGDTLMMALLRLWQVQNRPELELRLVHCDR
jgi:hypothetical protein